MLEVWTLKISIFQIVVFKPLVGHEIKLVGHDQH